MDSFSSENLAKAASMAVECRVKKKRIGIKNVFRSIMMIAEKAESIVVEERDRMLNAIWKERLIEDDYNVQTYWPYLKEIERGKGRG